jgi:hypothetical protein
MESLLAMCTATSSNTTSSNSSTSGTEDTAKKTNDTTSVNAFTVVAQRTLTLTLEFSAIVAGVAIRSGEYARCHLNCASCKTSALLLCGLSRATGHVPSAQQLQQLNLPGYLATLTGYLLSPEVLATGVEAGLAFAAGTTQALRVSSLGAAAVGDADAKGEGT